MRKGLKLLLYDLCGSLCLGISVLCFAVSADFAPGGVTGIAIILNFLLKIPIGLAIILINIPIILFTYKKLGNRFFLLSFKSVIINSLMLDYVICFFPLFEGSRLLSSVLSGIFAGIGYALFFKEGSSTGGTDFIIVACNKNNSKLSLGYLAFIIDISIVILYSVIFHNIASFFYGLIYTLITSIILDLTMRLLNKFIK